MRNNLVPGGQIELKAIALYHNKPVFLFNQEHIQDNGYEIPFKAFNDDTGPTPLDTPAKLYFIIRLLFDKKSHYDAIFPIE